MNYKARNWVRRQSPRRIIAYNMTIENLRHPKRAFFNKVAADAQASRRSEGSGQTKWRPGINQNDDIYNMCVM